jgi:hypothetical protein
MFLLTSSFTPLSLCIVSIIQELHPKGNDFY